MLSRILIIAEEGCAPDEIEHIRRGVGLSIGKIESTLLDLVYIDHPDLNDLKERS